LLPDALAGEHPKKAMTTMEHCHVRFSYNPSFSAYFFSQNSVSACFFSEENGAMLTMACMVHISYDVQTFGLIIVIVSFVYGQGCLWIEVSPTLLLQEH